MRLEKYILNEKSMTMDQVKKFMVKNNYSISDTELYQLEVLWKKITKECQPFLKDLRKVSKGWFVLRGMSNHGGSGYVKVRKDRRPVDTRISTHNRVDKIIEDLYGWKPRSEGLFGTGIKSTADRYGSPHIIFPTGKYEFLWSKKVYDAYNELRDVAIGQKLLKMFPQEMKKIWEQKYGEGKNGVWTLNNMPTPYEVNSFDYEKSVREFTKMLASEGNEKEMEKIVRRKLEWEPMVSQSDWESIVRGGDFMDEQRPPEMEKMIDDALEKIVADTLDYRDDGLEEALRSGHEIQFKCDGYYHFSITYGKVLELLIWGE